MRIGRRGLLATTLAALAAGPVRASPSTSKTFLAGFLWGASTAGHQIEGNNVNNDQWLFENVKPQLPASPSGDACNSFELWRTDLDIVSEIGLNSFRFSIEWGRVEPEEGRFSLAMLDHYKSIIDGCLSRGIAPVVTLCHFTTPRWFASKGGWLNENAPELFARYCDRTIRHLGGGIRYLATLNEPNNALLLQSVLPPQFWAGLEAALAECARQSGSERFTLGNTVLPRDVETVTRKHAGRASSRTSGYQGGAA